MLRCFQTDRPKPAPRDVTAAESNGRQALRLSVSHKMKQNAEILAFDWSVAVTWPPYYTLGSRLRHFLLKIFIKLIPFQHIINHRTPQSGTRLNSWNNHWISGPRTDAQRQRPLLCSQTSTAHAQSWKKLERKLLYHLLVFILYWTLFNNYSFKFW